MRVANIFILPPELLTQIFQFLSLSDRLHFRFVRYLGIQYLTSTGGAVCKGATPSVEQPGGRGFKPRLRSLLD
jgi:hypothetical protein